MLKLRNHLLAAAAVAALVGGYASSASAAAITVTLDPNGSSLGTVGSGAFNTNDATGFHNDLIVFTPTSATTANFTETGVFDVTTFNLSPGGPVASGVGANYFIYGTYTATGSGTFNGGAGTFNGGASTFSYTLYISTTNPSASFTGPGGATTSVPTAPVGTTLGTGTLTSSQGAAANLPSGTANLNVTTNFLVAAGEFGFFDCSAAPWSAARDQHHARPGRVPDHQPGGAERQPGPRAADPHQRGRAGGQPGRDRGRRPSSSACGQTPTWASSTPKPGRSSSASRQAPRPRSMFPGITRDATGPDPQAANQPPGRPAPSGCFPGRRPPQPLPAAGGPARAPGEPDRSSRPGPFGRNDRGTAPGPARGHQRAQAPARPPRARRQPPAATRPAGWASPCSRSSSCCRCSPGASSSCKAWSPATTASWRCRSGTGPPCCPRCEAASPAPTGRSWR